jgi:hypothetical protein
MALSIDYLYKFSLDLILKNQSGGLKSTAFANHWNDAQSTYFDDLVGRFQARNNGKEGMQTGLILNETILQKLSPFIKTINMAISVNTAGKPIDFVFRLAMRTGGYNCIKINQSEIADVSNSVIDPASSTNSKYYFYEYAGRYIFTPNGLASADLDYISLPKDVVWGFTYDEDGRQVYDASTSVQPQWDNMSCREITKRMLTNIGVAFKEPDFSNFGKSVQLTGE